MALKFSANVSTMFQEVAFLERFDKAKANGFQAIEIQNPYDFEPEVIKARIGDLKCDLINIYSDKPFGCAAVPMYEEQFCAATNKILYYYNAFGFKKLHILSGERNKTFLESEQFNTLVQNLRALVHGSDFLDDINVTAVIEPICGEVNEKYYLNSFDRAIDVIKAVDHKNIKLLLDIFHLHKITGDVHKYLDIYYPFAGHVQISQDPGRCEPFHPNGKIDYVYVFDFLRQKKHADFIGLEYTPTGTTEESLNWMKKYI